MILFLEISLVEAKFLDNIVAICCILFLVNLIDLKKYLFSARREIHRKYGFIL